MATGNIPSKARRLEIDGKTFHYIVGDTFIPIWLPSGKKHLTNWNEVTGITWAILEKDYKRGGKYYYPITPAHIKDYIIKNKLNEEE